MYLHIYGFRELPFEEDADSRFACLFAQGREALAHLEHTTLVGQAALMVLTGDAGVGKTQLARLLAERLVEQSVRVGRVEASGQLRDASDWLLSIYMALGVPLPLSSEPTDEERLIQGLAAAAKKAEAQGQRCLLIVDDAEHLGDVAYAALDRLLEAAAPALHLLLVGRPVLREALQNGPALALGQRAVTRLPLSPLSVDDSERYLRHRMHVAGMTRMPFSRLGLQALRDYGEGYPGRLNAIAHRALERGAAVDEASVGERTVARAARDVLPNYAGYWLRRYRFPLYGAAGVLLLLLLIGGWNYFRSGRSPALPTNLASVAPELALEKMRAAMPEASVAKLRVWGELLARWQVGSKDASVADAMNCDAVIFPGFNCISGHGTLDQLRRFDRPIVLELEDGANHQQVLLVGAGDKNVRLYVGGSYVELSRDAFAEVWKGRFYGVFRVEPGLPSQLHRGDQGVGIVWIRQRLPSTGSSREQAGANVFDRTVEDRVKNLQAYFGIADDGVVGPETMFALSAREGDGPHLARNVP
jgi:general secretion pathway protein A